MKEHIKNQSFRADKEVWKIPRLIKLAEDLESFDLPLKHLNIHNLFPFIETTKDFVKQIQRVLDADLKYPIILDEEGYVMDGRHRILKALLEKHESIRAVRFETTPDCCFVEP